MTQTFFMFLFILCISPSLLAEQFNYNSRSTANPFNNACDSLVSAIAVVNKYVITSNEITERARVVTDGQYDNLSEDAKVAVQQVALQGLIDDAILHTLISEKKLHDPFPKDPKTLLQYFAKNAGMPTNHFIDLASRLNVSIEHLAAMLRCDQMWRVLAVQEMEKMNTQNTSTSINNEPCFLLEEIVVPAHMPPAQLDSAIQQAVSEGISFGQMAASMSLAPSVFQNGSVGWIPESDLPDHIRQSLINTPVGKHTQAIRSGRHIVVYRVSGRRTPQEAQDTKKHFSGKMLSLSLHQKPAQREKQLLALNTAHLSVASSEDLQKLADQHPTAYVQIHTKALKDAFPDAVQPFLQKAKTKSKLPVIVDPKNEKAYIIFLDQVTQSNESVEESQKFLELSAVLRRMKNSLRKVVMAEMLVEDWSI